MRFAARPPLTYHLCLSVRLKESDMKVKELTSKEFEALRVEFLQMTQDQDHAQHYAQKIRDVEEAIDESWDNAPPFPEWAKTASIPKAEQDSLNLLLSIYAEKGHEDFDELAKEIFSISLELTRKIIDIETETGMKYNKWLKVRGWRNISDQYEALHRLLVALNSFKRNSQSTEDYFIYMP